MNKLYSLILLILLSIIINVTNVFSKEVLRWAADAESGAPYVFQDPDNPSVLIGFEADIIRAIAKKLGMDEVHVQNQWDGLIPGLNRGDYDVAINGLEITSDRKEVVNFSIPYYLTYEQLVVRVNEYEIQSLADVVGKKAGTLKGSLAERILRAKGGIDVRTYDSEVNSYTDLKKGRIDAVLIDEPVVKYYAGWNKELRLVGQPIGEVSYGIVTRKSDTLLLSKINKAISSLILSGELREILERWNLWNYTFALYLNDKSESNIEPTEFKKFIKRQGKEVTFFQLMKRYLSFMPILGEAAWMTLQLSVISMIIAIILGLLVALLRIYAPPPISTIAVIYIEVIRGTPLLIQLFFIYFALPTIGIEFSPFLAAIIGLGINYSAYEAEVYRAGLFSVPNGQMEAAISLGMSKSQALRYIILPQATRLVIPPITNDFISLLKDSSLVSVITMVELTKAYGQLAATYYDYVGTGIIVALFYLLLGLPFVKLSRMAEKKFSHNMKIQGED